MSQFFVQEYEGRDNKDISLIPWLHHRSLFSACLHCLYNPSKEEFNEWIAAAERETWKHIPAIKSHIAEEITLDHCVQRLRKRLLAESWEKRRSYSTGKKMGERVPSFFVSPSLVNLGGLGVSDQANIEEIDQHKLKESTNPSPDIPIISSLDPNHGWAGLGLRGNRSSGSLERTLSAASGLFIEGEGVAMEQIAGEHTAVDEIQKASSANSLDSGNRDYIKTTSMARFYYRNSSSYGNLPRSRSHEHLDNGQGTSSQRKKSKSHTDMSSSLQGAAT
jgi:hypothetical protein